MTGPLPDPPDLDPQALSGTSFGRSRRGFEPTEVRSMLGRAADALRVWSERDSKMAERIAELSARLDEAEEFDEARVTELLGAETARIVAAARDAAAEIRAQAETDARELDERTRSEAEAAAEALVGAAKADREAAEKALSEATESAERMVTEATESSEATLAGAREEAERVVDEARTEAETLRSEARTQSDEMLESAGTVLSERTAEAEAAAAEIRGRADEALSDAQEKATADLERARAQSAELVSAAEREAEELRESAREQGREMVEEARDLRRQMLQDAAEKSRVGRQKVEAAKAARDAVVNAIRTAGGHLGETLAELDDSDAEMRRAADSAALSVPDDTHEVARALEADLDRDRPTVEPTEAAADPDGESTTDEGLDDGDGTAETEDANDAEVEAGEESESTDGDEATVVTLTDPDAGSGDDPDDLDESGGSDQVDDGATIASVHDLFERIRAEEPPASSEGDTVAAAEPGNVAVLEAAPEPDGSDPTADEAVGELSSEPAAEPDAGAREADGDGAAGEPQGDDAVLARRTELLAPAEKLTARAVKRLFGDEQNEVLDRTRRLRRSRAEVGDLLGEDDSSALEHFSEALTEPYLLAATAGAQQWADLSEDDSHTAPRTEDVLEGLNAQVAEVLELRRARVRDLLASNADAGGDNSDLVDRIRSVYRDYRGSDATSLASDIAAGGFAVGSAVAARAGSTERWRWIADDAGKPCADCDDNSLEGPVAVDGEFPTGHTLPPAHPGCRCIVVPVDA